MIKRKLEYYHFPEGVKSVFINGKYYSRKKFIEARSKELRAKKQLRDKNGRFTTILESPK
tara:strand:+ start:238 stop:417 length:180 start_codon:yes stop_codon:yes gene_type:complete